MRPLDSHPLLLPSGNLKLEFESLSSQYRSEVAEEEGAVVAGINGFTLESETNKITKKATTVIQAKHSWALLLDRDSVFRRAEREN